MGYGRNHTEPFWATSLSKMAPAGRTLAIGVDALIRRSAPLAPYLWVGGGWREGSGEHFSGRALDIISRVGTGKKLERDYPEEFKAMELLADFLVQNAEKIGIRHIIWNEDIYRTRYREWELDGPITSPHQDHLHIYLDEGSPGWHNDLNTVTVTEPGDPNMIEELKAQITALEARLFDKKSGLPVHEGWRR